MHVGLCFLWLLCFTKSLVTAQDLCYELSWDLQRPEGPRHQTLRPVTKIPAESGLTSLTVCGQQLQAGLSERDVLTLT